MVTEIPDLDQFLVNLTFTRLLLLDLRKINRFDLQQ